MLTAILLKPFDVLTSETIQEGLSWHCEEDYP
jgi:hypothetical protein